MIIPSYFGDLATTEALQFILDRSQDLLGQASIWRNFLDQGITSASLDFTAAIGRDRISAVASIVDSDSPAPMRTRNKLERYSGKIPAMKEKFRMSQDDMRNLEILRGLQFTNGQGGATPQDLVRFLTKDLLEAAVAGDKRVDLMMLQGISTLTIDVTSTGNPDGAAFGTIDLLPQSYQKQGVPVVWTDIASTPIDDIENFININRNTRGRTFGQILMSNQLWLVFKKTTQVKSMLQTFFNVGKANATFAVTLDNVNEFLTANNWPTITIVNYTSMIEVDGLPTYVQGFNANNVVFAPSGKLGTLMNAFCMESLHPVQNKTYANYGPTLVGKWMVDDPLAEYTGMEMNAFPALAIDGIFILTTNVVQTPFV